MPDFAELEQRIEALCARASAEHPDARLLVEIEDLLAEGYICALHADHRSRRLQERFDALVEAVDAAEAAQELQRVAREQRMVSEAAHELRSQLAVMRQHWVALGSERLGLA
jgi:signal transduction histidine kinase